MARATHRRPPMLDTEVPQTQLNSKLEVTIGVSTDSNPDTAIAEAAGLAARRLGSAAPDFALVVTAGSVARDTVGSLREVLGPISVAGGAATALLTDHGLSREGALVVCVSNADGAASGVAGPRTVPAWAGLRLRTSGGG